MTIRSAFVMIAMGAGVVGMTGTAGCRMGPEHERPVTVADDAARFVNSAGEAGDKIEVNHWWERLGDDVTAGLVERALENNHDLQTLAARVDEARAMSRVARSTLFPTMSVDAGRRRSKSVIEIGPPIGRQTFLVSSYELSLGASYEFDLWGKLHRTRQAAWADLLAVETDRAAATHSIVATVVRLRVNVAILQRQLALAEANTASLGETREIVESRYERGVAQALELRLARENYAAAQATEPQLRQLLATTMHALDVVVARRPGTGELPQDTLADLPELTAPPTAIPATLLDRRPDLNAAELRVAASTARVGVAIADLYPDLTISGMLGLQSNDIGNLFRADNFIYSTALNAAMTVFAGGRLQAEVDAAKARAEAAASEYAKAVLNAIREVEDALVQERGHRKRLEFLEVRLNEAQAAEDLARERYQQGLVPLLTVLETERRRRSAENDLLTTKHAIWDARIDLYLALGGDWFDENDDS